MCPRKSAPWLSRADPKGTARAFSGALELLRIEDAEVIASGGGTQNKAIMHWLQLAIQDLNGPLRRSEELGVPSEAKEALAFALLAAATLENEPSNVPSCTGATRRAVLGCITPRP